MKMSRRGWLAALVGACARRGVRPTSAAEAAELTLPAGASEEGFDFETAGVERWTTVAGRWTVEDMDGAPSGKRVLVQREVRNEFNVIVAPPGPYTALDVSVKLEPIAGKARLLEHRDARFAAGRVGLWTKADSITAFDDLSIRGVPGGA